MSILQLRCTVLLCIRRNRLPRDLPRVEGTHLNPQDELLPARGARVQTRIRAVLGHQEGNAGAAQVTSYLLGTASKFHLFALPSNHEVSLGMMAIS